MTTATLFRFTAASLVLLASFTSAAPVSAETFTRYGRIEAQDTQETTLRIPARQRVHLEVEGDGDTDLDLYVYDLAGNLIARDDDYTDFCIVEWVQEEAGAVTIVLRNRGDVYNAYVWRREMSPAYRWNTSW